MINAILNGLLSFIGNLIGIVYLPIDTILSTAFPSLTSYINTFNSMLTTLTNFCTTAFGYIFSIFPPTCKSIIILYLLLLGAFYTISLVVHSVLKIIEVIKAIKIW